MDMFDWVEFPEGRARFSGGIRGWDDLRHETFCVEVDGRELFGEIVSVFAENRNNYNLEIISFGYKEDGDVGLDISACVALTKEQTQRVANLVRKLIAVVSKIDTPPSILSNAKELFLGDVILKNDWTSHAY
jgi:hypothetical protein